MRLLEKKCPSCQNIDAQTILPKNGPIGQKRLVLVFSRGIATIEMRCTFSLGNWSFNTELHTEVRLFEEMSKGPRYGGLIFRLRGNGDQKLGEGISKKLKTTPKKFSTMILDLKFNVDHDFTIKHDLTQRFDQVRVV